jgi:hypothetical protein
LNAAAGIAQGMMTNTTTAYEENASYFTWSLTALLGGFAGLDYLVLGKPWQFINLLISAIFVVGYLSFILTMPSWTDLLSFRGIMSLIVLATLGVGVFAVWTTKIQVLLNPRGLVRNGVEMTDNKDKTLNWFMKLVSDKNGQPAEGYEEDYDVLKHYYSITHILGKQFEIGHSTGERPPPDPTPIGFPPATIVKVMGKQVYTAVIEPLLYLIPGYAEKQALQKAAMAAMTGKGLAGIAEGVGGKLLERSGLKGAVGQATGLMGQAEGLMSEAKGAIGQVTGVANQMSAEQLLNKAVEGSGLKSTVEQATGVAGQIKGIADQVKGLGNQSGGGSGLTTESKITGAVVLAILVGGALKGVVDHLVES